MLLALSLLPLQQTLMPLPLIVLQCIQINCFETNLPGPALPVPQALFQILTCLQNIHVVSKVLLSESCHTMLNISQKFIGKLTPPCLRNRRP